jgi:mannose-6-phosphate isomerase-like protein (cupin superfamily)
MDQHGQTIRVLNRLHAPRVELSDHRSFDGRHLYQSTEGTIVLSSVMDPGGAADEHVHEGMTHVFVVTEGELVIGTANGREERAFFDDTVIIPAGTAHYAENRGTSLVRYVAISIPDSKGTRAH